jgi:hypothetical protein
MGEFPRELTQKERDILDFLIEANDGSERLAALLTDTKVTKECRCGCGSLELTVDPSRAAENWPDDVWGDIGLRHAPLPVEAGSTAEPGWLALLHVARTDAQLEFLWGGMDNQNHPPLPIREQLQTVRRGPAVDRQSSR